MVSIIMPCYNAEKYVEEAIRSVFNQTYPHWELIIMDDGSKDESVSKIRGLLSAFPLETRVHLYEQPNQGACKARNNALVHAKGEYVKFLDADDILCPDCLEKQIAQMAALQPNQIPFGDYEDIDADGIIIGHHPFSESDQNLLREDPVAFFIARWSVMTSCPLHRRDWVNLVGGYAEELPRHQEQDFHERLALAGLEFVYFPNLCYYYRDYVSQSRISSQHKEGSLAKKKTDIQMFMRNEQLLLGKYGVMPQKYWQMFGEKWFVYARLCFAEKNDNEGRKAMLKACQYGLSTRFEKYYYHIGKVCGYSLLESVLLLRLKLIGKR